MITVQHIADLVSGTVIGDKDKEISKLMSLSSADNESVTFIADKKMLSQLQVSKAGLVLLSENVADQFLGNRIVVTNPYLAFAKVSKLFDPEPDVNGIHSTAIVHSTASLGDKVSIGPNAVISADCKIGNGCQIGAGAFIGERTEIGESSRVYPNASLYHDIKVGNHCAIHSGTVIGSHGFGYAPSPEGWEKIAQIGRVIIEDNVEIGANCAVDRGAIGDTVIRKGAIIDNLVHLAHNVEVGENTALAAQVGSAGSTKIGANCMAGGQVGFAGHISVSNKAVFTGQAMVTKSVSEPGTYSSGIPAMDNKVWRKAMVRLRQLESMNQKIKELEKKLKDLKSDD